MPGAIGTAGLVVSSAVGYGRLTNRRWTDVAFFAGAAVFVTAFFFGIFAAFSPQFLVPLRRLFGI